MIKKLQKYPFFLFLLPIFFVLHGFVENFGFVGIQDAAILLFSYLFLAVSIAAFSYIFFRSTTKAALITSIYMSFFFFFAAVHEFLEAHAPLRFFSRYSFMLPFILVLLFVTFIFFKKTKKPFIRFSLFLNVLLLIYVAIDTGTMIWKIINPVTDKLSVYGFTAKKDYKICDTCLKPDIYFLLFDEYASSLSLKEKYNFHNDLDSILEARGFSIQSKSQSNYYFTPFSMSSILNMSYIEGIKNTKAVTSEDYTNCANLIRNNEVIKLLDAYGYDIINYSVFDLAGHPAEVKQSFLPLKTKLITDRTLFARMNKDIGWLLITRFPFNLFSKTYYLQHVENNKGFIERLKKSSAEKQKKPRFFYAHLYMPHAPFFFDKNGRLKDRETIYSEYYTSPPSSYLEYVIYTNSEIKKLVDTIQKNNPSSVIIIMGDHGFRVGTSGAKDLRPRYFFQNMNAVYFPDRDYHLLHDDITGVNQFRVIFNKLFHQQFPLLKDSSVYLADKKLY